MSNQGVSFRIRGIGTDWTPGCFVCGGKNNLYSNIAAFVESKEDGEKCAGFFKTGAWLDYRSFEPNWIQVKVGACDVHLKNLENLCKLVEDNGYTITLDLVNEAMLLASTLPGLEV